MVHNAIECNRYSDTFMKLIKNLVAFEADKRLDLFSIARFLKHYRSKNEIQISPIYEEEIKLSNGKFRIDL